MPSPGGGFHALSHIGPRRGLTEISLAEDTLARANPPLPGVGCKAHPFQGDEE